MLPGGEVGHGEFHLVRAGRVRLVRPQDSNDVVAVGKINASDGGVGVENFGAHGNVAGSDNGGWGGWGGRGWWVGAGRAGGGEGGGRWGGGGEGRGRGGGGAGWGWRIWVRGAVRGSGGRGRREWRACR